MKTIRYNGRVVIVAAPRRKQRPVQVLAPCRGRLLVNCQNGPGCKGHLVRWIALRT